MNEGWNMDVSLALGMFSLVISLVAILIAVQSARMMKSVANLEYDEKLAVMASHSEKIKADKSLRLTETIRNDFYAVSNLKKYASNEKKDRLIEDYIIPILKETIGSENMNAQQVIAIKDIIDIALKYDIASDKVKNLRQRLRQNQ